MRLHMKPWLRVNGSLNRRCLDRWLATVLMHCISNAGVTLAQLARRFSLLLPVHVRDMLDYMRRLGWVRLMALRGTGGRPEATVRSFWDAYAAPVEGKCVERPEKETRICVIEIVRVHSRFVQYLPPIWTPWTLCTCTSKLTRSAN